METQGQHTSNLEQYLAQSLEKVPTAQALRRGVLGEQVAQIAGEEPDARRALTSTAQGAACPHHLGKGAHLGAAAQESPRRCRPQATGAAPRCPRVVAAPTPEATGNSSGSAASFAEKEPLEASPGDARLRDDATSLSEMPPPAKGFLS